MGIIKKIITYVVVPTVLIGAGYTCGYQAAKQDIYQTLIRTGSVHSPESTSHDLVKNLEVLIEKEKR